jgi:hypothetical protein
VLDQLFQVLRLQLADVEVHSLRLKRRVDSVVQAGRQEGRQSHAGAQQIERNADVHLGVVSLARLHLHAQVLGRLRSRGLHLGVGHRGEQAIGIDRGDLPIREHVQDAASFFEHAVFLRLRQSVQRE